FDFVLRVEMGKVGPQVFRYLARARRLDVEYARHPRIDRRNVERAAGFERDRITALAQRRQEAMTVLLRERLTAGNGHVTRAIGRHGVEHGRYGHGAAAVKCVRSVAITAA